MLGTIVSILVQRRDGNGFVFSAGVPGKREEGLFTKERNLRPQ